MKNTFCHEMGKANNGQISGYRISENKHELVVFSETGNTEETWIGYIPAGEIILNAEDLNKWDMSLHSNKILRPDMYQHMINYTTLGQHDAYEKKNRLWVWCQNR